MGYRYEARRKGLAFIFWRFFVGLTSNTGDVLRIEGETGALRHAPGLEDYNVDAVSTRGNGEASSSTHVTHAADANPPWTIQVRVSPCDGSSGLKGTGGERSGDHSTGDQDHGMVLYNVGSGTQFHVR